MELRDYQKAAINAVVKEHGKGVHRQLLVMPTGSGKTVTFAHLVKGRPGRTLVLAHREELIDQSIATIQTVNPQLKVDKEMAGYQAEAASDIVVAGVATLGRKGTSRITKFDWSSFATVIVDEAHHSTAESYRRIFEASGVLQPPKLLIGVTATPARPDGITLSDIYEKIVYTYSLRQAITDGWLARPRGYRITTSANLDDLKTTNGEFVQRELAERVNTSERNQQIVKVWKEYANGRRTIIFAAGIQHAQDLAERFAQNGVPSKAVWGDDPERKTKLKGHQNGEYEVLVNVGIALEGYDDPNISCVVVARPTESHLVYQQAIGRGLRPVADKENCLVLDFCDNSSRHSLMTLPCLLGLHSTLDLQGCDLLHAVEELEMLQAEHPAVDFAKVDSLTSAHSVIEQVDLMQIRFPEEVEKNSDLTWFRAIDGGYKMLIPKEGQNAPGFVRIYEDTLGRWNLVGKINGEDFHGSRATFEEAIKVCDEQIRGRIGKITLQYLLREATWHSKKVTPGQRQMLIRLFPKRLFPWEQMTAGQASKMISERLARKVG